ncbi:MAG: DUF488 domain-containing protein [Candidatus Dormibacterales bacterium]
MTADEGGGEAPCFAHLLDEGGSLPGDRIRLERVYGEPAGGQPPGGRRRVLVDGVWPRGVTREAAHLDAWLREAAPSAELRRWFGHRPERWEEFQRRYREELAGDARRQAVDELEAMAQEGPLTLLFGARDEEHNQARVLKDVLGERLRR